MSDSGKSECPECSAPFVNTGTMRFPEEGDIRRATSNYECGSCVVDMDGVPQFWQVHHCEIAALTQRVEQATSDYLESKDEIARLHVSRSWLQKALTAAESELKRLEKFKVYTHQRLDELGAPESVPESPHTAAGCRVGWRFDWVRDLIAGEVACVREAEDDRIAAESREKRLREGIEAAMRIKDLWAPTNDWSVEHAEEAKALEMMRFNFEFLLAQPSDGKEAEGGKLS